MANSDRVKEILVEYADAEGDKTLVEEILAKVEAAPDGSPLSLAYREFEKSEAAYRVDVADDKAKKHLKKTWDKVRVEAQKVPFPIIAPAPASASVASATVATTAPVAASSQSAPANGSTAPAPAASATPPASASASVSAAAPASAAPAASATASVPSSASAAVTVPVSPVVNTNGPTASAATAPVAASVPARSPSEENRRPTPPPLPHRVHEPRPREVPEARAEDVVEVPVRERPARTEPNLPSGERSEPAHVQVVSERNRPFLVTIIVAVIGLIVLVTWFVTLQGHRQNHEEIEKAYLEGVQQRTHDAEMKKIDELRRQVDQQ